MVYKDNGRDRCEDGEKTAGLNSDDEPGFMLIDGTGVAPDLGILLGACRYQTPPLTLLVSHPTTGKPFIDSRRHIGRQSRVQGGGGGEARLGGDGDDIGASKAGHSNSGWR